MPRPAKPRIGRPPTRGVTATAHFDVRVTPEERDLWRAAAAPDSVSEWLRALANRAAKRKAVREVTGICSVGTNHD